MTYILLLLGSGIGSLYAGLMLLVTVGASFSRLKQSRSNGRSTAPESKLRFVVIVPAHNEESTIARTVASIRDLNYPVGMLSTVVIADNCSDGTATAARLAGADVYVRTSPLKSKGHALEEYLSHLLTLPSPLPVDAWMIIDADSQLDRDFLHQANRALLLGHSWFQGYYTVASPDQHWRTRLMTWAFALFNGTWNLGSDAIGLGAAIRGNGFGGTLAALRRVPWQAHGLAEDLEFGWELRVRNERVTFLCDAKVMADMPVLPANAASQRQRWETGRQAVRQNFLRRVLTSKQGFWRKVLLLVDLTMPPMGRWLVGLAMFLGLVLIHAMIRPESTPFQICAMVFLLVTVLYAFSPFALMGLPARFALSALHIPRYLIWKGALALGAKPKAWVRTEREIPRDR